MGRMAACVVDAADNSWPDQETRNGFSQIFFRNRRLKREREVNERLQAATYRFIYGDKDGLAQG